jgi:hypothetical protein
MAQFIYLDETGSVGKGAKSQPLLTLVAVIVDEDKVQPLARAFRDLAMKHLGWRPLDFEFHGFEVWGGCGYWADMNPPKLIAAYKDVIGLLDTFDLDVAHASIDKAGLHKRHDGAADEGAYRLALQFLVEKLDRYGSQNKVLIADEAKEQRLRAIMMVADLQEWGSGEVPGRTARTIIDSLHFVASHASPGVRLADMVAYAMQRRQNVTEHHPDAQAAIDRIHSTIQDHVRTWREPWPARPIRSS